MKLTNFLICIKFHAKFANFTKKLANSYIFDGVLPNFFIASGAKCENLEDLEKCCKMSI